QGEPLQGSIDVLRQARNEVVLRDIGFTYDCALGYEPDGRPGQGVAFAFGSVGAPILADLDSAIGCSDGLLDYLLSLQACDDPKASFSALLSLDNLSLPASGCLMPVGAPSARRLMTIREVTPDQARLAFPVIYEAYRFPFSGAIPRNVPLPPLNVGTTYTLVVTVTDGNTLPRSMERDFIYRGEKHLVINRAATPSP